MIVRFKMVLRDVRVLMVLAVLGLPLVAAAADPPVAPRRVTIDLLSEKQTVAPGDDIWIALRERIAPGWHTYWTNPGDSGETTTVVWQLPAGVTAGPLQFPMPSAIPVGPLVNYGYAGEVVLLTKGTRQVVLRQAEGEPVPVRPPGYFSDCYSDEDAAESNRLASASPTTLVD